MLNFKEVNQIEGWFVGHELGIKNCWTILNAISNIQGSGHFVEIGTYQGKRFVVFADLLKENETGLAVDIWGNYSTEFNHDFSGRCENGEQVLTNFIKNVNNFNSSKNIRTLIKDSREKNTIEKIKEALRWNKTNKVRIFSIDGNHSYPCTLNDLRIASELLSDDGIIIIDDYYNWDWPGVKTATDTWLLENKDYTCFYATHDMLIICKRIFYQKIIDSIQEDTECKKLLFCQQSQENIKKANIAGIWGQ